MKAVLTAVALLALNATAAPKPPQRVAAAPHGKREQLRRTVTVTDDTHDIDIHVAAGQATTLIFPRPVAAATAPDAQGYFRPDGVKTTDRLVVLLPNREVKAGEAISLTVVLTDGSLLPFVVSSIKESFDLTLEVVVARKARGAPESVEVLKSQVGELQGKLDDCQQSAGTAGERKLADLILRQDPTKTAAFVVERHPAKQLDKQARLLVETLHVYRLFDSSFLVLTVENRDPVKLWVLDRVEVSVASGSSTADTRVIDVEQELSQGIPPSASSRLVVVFKTPPDQSADHRFTLKLLEKDGNRHVTLTGLRF